MYLHVEAHIVTSSRPFYTRVDIHVCTSLSSIQAFTDGCEKFAQPDVGEQLLQTLVHNILGKHPQLELADDPDQTNTLMFAS
jgi:hypothetical protein